MKTFLVVLGLLLTPCVAVAQQQEKVEIQVTNNRSEKIVMRFAYAFRERMWTLMEHEISAADDITYRFPANIPGCEKLHEWGIADGVLSVTSPSGLLCQQRVSLCDKTLAVMEVSNTQCVWRRAGVKR